LNLTDQEKNYIARRAAGSFAIIPAVQRIVEAHKKNRNPDDAVFLEFARLVLRKSFTWDEYERQSQLVAAIIPHPFGIPWHLKEKLEPADAPEVAPTKKKKKARRVVKCGICAGEGHNARTCPSKPDTSTVTHTDGIERLSPGFDPNPPRVEESHEHQNKTKPRETRDPLPGSHGAPEAT